MSPTGDQRDAELDALEHEIGVMIRRAKRVVTARAAQVHPDLYPASYLMLGLLRDRGQLRASEVCDVFAIDKGAVSRQVQHVVELGLVERTADPDDRRASLLALTEMGRERLAVVDERRRDLLRQRVDDWADSDLADLVATLARYNALFASDEGV